ncbi:MAG: glucosamine-6-phosphate deaminase [Lachnospiraceae bacterium]|nr:glucosamine-6-phosphate deaminase [Lachnospiraceae bacterium]
MRVYLAKNYNDMSRKAANIISAQIIMKPNAVLGLATGSSPVGTYKQLIEWYKKGDLDFSEVTSVNLDEYIGLGPEDKNSYSYFMRSNFFDHINIDSKKTYIPNGLENDEKKECDRYNLIISRCGGIDLQLLGIGNNGHIGFNEPGTTFESETHRVTLSEKTLAANSRFFESIDKMPKYAYSMGIKNIMQARRILLIASGKDKSDALYKALFGAITPNVPASILQLHNNLTVIADEKALSQILSTHTISPGGHIL